LVGKAVNTVIHFHLKVSALSLFFLKLQMIRKDKFIEEWGRYKALADLFTWAASMLSPICLPVV
jgi:hypothetical protein|tara:strand:- start:891 stop:1082 length:192 start_codon:yes stop_codon:yes gene_type:complete